MEPGDRARACGDQETQRNNGGAMMQPPYVLEGNDP